MLPGNNSRQLRGWPRVIAAVAGAVLGTAALAKIFLPAAGASLFGTIAHAAPWFSWTAIAIELALAIWLLSGRRTTGAAAVAILLFSIFSGVIMRDMLQRHPKPCGCFGAAWKQAHEPATIERHLAVGLGGDLMLAGALAAAFITGGRPPALSAAEAEPSGNASV